MRADFRHIEIVIALGDGWPCGGPSCATAFVSDFGNRMPPW
jgi:hypothetical protein